jgi:hypothetical protein
MFQNIPLEPFLGQREQNTNEKTGNITVPCLSFLLFPVPSGFEKSRKEAEKNC